MKKHLVLSVLSGKLSCSGVYPRRNLLGITWVCLVTQMVKATLLRWAKTQPDNHKGDGNPKAIIPRGQLDVPTPLSPQRTPEVPQPPAPSSHWYFTPRRASRRHGSAPASLSGVAGNTFAIYRTHQTKSLLLSS